MRLSVKPWPCWVKADRTRPGGLPSVILPKGTISTVNRDIQVLSRPEGRRVSGPGHDQAVEYLTGRMAESGLQPLHGDCFHSSHDAVHPSTGEPVTLVNLAGVIRGRSSSERPLILGAHYDSAIDAPCSDDNAASIAVILAAIRELAGHGLNRDLIAIFFDAEERPFFGTNIMGSELFCRTHLEDLVPVLILVLDVIGHPFSFGVPILERFFNCLRDLFFVTGSESGSSLPGLIETAAEDLDGMRLVPTLNKYVGDVSDHGNFRRRGLPYLFLSAGPTDYHHTLRDVPSVISDRRLEAVLHFLLRLVVTVDRRPPVPGEGCCDPVDFEVSMLRRSIGWLLYPLLFAMGLPFPKSREDLDGLAALLSSYIQ